MLVFHLSVRRRFRIHCDLFVPFLFLRYVLLKRRNTLVLFIEIVVIVACLTNHFGFFPANFVYASIAKMPRIARLLLHVQHSIRSTLRAVHKKCRIKCFLCIFPIVCIAIQTFLQVWVLCWICWLHQLKRKESLQHFISY